MSKHGTKRKFDEEDEDDETTTQFFCRHDDCKDRGFFNDAEFYGHKSQIRNPEERDMHQKVYMYVPPTPTPVRAPAAAARAAPAVQRARMAPDASAPAPMEGVEFEDFDAGGADDGGASHDQTQEAPLRPVNRRQPKESECVENVLNSAHNMFNEQQRNLIALIDGGSFTDRQKHAIFKYLGTLPSAADLLEKDRVWMTPGAMDADIKAKMEPFATSTPIEFVDPDNKDGEPIKFTIMIANVILLVQSILLEFKRDKLTFRSKWSDDDDHEIDDIFSAHHMKELEDEMEYWEEDYVGILSIILFSDSSRVRKGSGSGHPVILGSGNVAPGVRRLDIARRLACYMPEWDERSPNQWAALVNKIFATLLEVFAEYADTGLVFRLQDSSLIRLYPRVSCFVMDLPELQYANTQYSNSSSAECKCPCCLTPTKHLGRIPARWTSIADVQTGFTARDNDKIRDEAAAKSSKTAGHAHLQRHSVRDMKNHLLRAMRKLGFSVSRNSTYCELLHLIEQHGLFEMVLEALRDHIEAFLNLYNAHAAALGLPLRDIAAAKAMFNQNAQGMPEFLQARFSHLPPDLASATRISSNMMVFIIQHAPLLIRGVLPTAAEARAVGMSITGCYEETARVLNDVLLWYNAVLGSSFTSKSLVQLQNDCVSMKEELQRVFFNFKGWSTLKWHLLDHVPMLIWLLGPLTGISAHPFEQFHNLVVKLASVHDNLRAGRDDRMLQWVLRRTLTNLAFPLPDDSVSDVPAEADTTDDVDPDVFQSEFEQGLELLGYTKADLVAADEEDDAVDIFEQANAEAPKRDRKQYLEARTFVETHQAQLHPEVTAALLESTYRDRRLINEEPCLYKDGQASFALCRAFVPVTAHGSRGRRVVASKTWMNRRLPHRGPVQSEATIDELLHNYRFNNIQLAVRERMYVTSTYFARILALVYVKPPFDQDFAERELMALVRWYDIVPPTEPIAGRESNPVGYSCLTLADGKYEMMPARCIVGPVQLVPVLDIAAPAQVEETTVGGGAGARGGRGDKRSDAGRGRGRGRGQGRGGGRGSREVQAPPPSRKPRGRGDGGHGDDPGDAQAGSSEAAMPPKVYYFVNRAFLPHY